MKAGNIHETNNGGSVTILEYSSSRDVLVEFNDQYKHQSRVHASDLRNGRVKNPYYPSVYGKGYLGVGYKAYINDKQTPEYQTWNNMLERCYNPKLHEKNPTYQGCTVSESWLNFQNYAYWFHLNYKEGWELDKDLLFPGNKVYSAETCRFIPQALNTLLNNRSRTRDLPQRVSKSRKNYKAVISIDSKFIYLGTYSTIKEAAEVYKQAKEENIKRMANKYKGEICPLIYKSLIEWEL